MALVIINGWVIQVRRASCALFTAGGSNQSHENDNDHDGEQALQVDRCHPDNGMTSTPLPFPVRDTSMYARVTPPAARQFRRTLSLGDVRDSTRTTTRVYDAFCLVGERGVGRSWWPWRSNAAVANVDDSASEEEDRRRRQSPKEDDQEAATAPAMVSPVRSQPTLSAGPSPSVHASRCHPYPWYCDGTVDDAAVGNRVRSAIHGVPVDADTSVLGRPRIHMRRWSSPSVILHRRPSWLSSRTTTTTSQDDQVEEGHNDNNHDGEDDNRYL